MLKLKTKIRFSVYRSRKVDIVVAAAAAAKTMPEQKIKDCDGQIIDIFYTAPLRHRSPERNDPDNIPSFLPTPLSLGGTPSCKCEVWMGGGGARPVAA